MGISRPTAYKWWRRWQSEGLDGLVDRSSRPHSSPARTAPEIEAAIAELRQELKLGPVRIGWRLGVPASTVHRVLVRLGLNRLDWLDRPTGRVIRRIVTSRCGELVHMDVKKLGRIPPGGGWRVHGREQSKGGHHHKGLGYAYLHTAIDAHSRLAYTEILADERAATTTAFWARANQFFNDHGITVEAVLTDNGPNYRSHLLRETLGPIQHRFTRPYRPQTNGKVERFHRTLAEEWAYVRPYLSEAERVAALDTWLHLYNHHRHHSALAGPPITRVNNLAGHYT
jgi:transposase InsO family protein